MRITASQHRSIAAQRWGGVATHFALLSVLWSRSSRHLCNAPFLHSAGAVPAPDVKRVDAVLFPAQPLIEPASMHYPPTASQEVDQARSDTKQQRTCVTSSDTWACNQLVLLVLHLVCTLETRPSMKYLHFALKTTRCQPWKASAGHIRTSQLGARCGG